MLFSACCSFFFDGPGTSRGGPLERDTLRRIHYQLNIRCARPERRACRCAADVPGRDSIC